MRIQLQSIQETPDHLALAYDAWAPVDIADGKIPNDKRKGWIDGLSGITISPDYAHAFERWKKGFTAPGDRVFELALASRLLVGHGNSSGSDVGITVHHTWGVPIIPGTAVKGLLSHYVDAVYGPDATSPPWEQPKEEQSRVRYQGVIRDDRRIVRGPGAVFRALFGAPEAEGDKEMRQHGFEAGAAAGLVTFHDALYVPGSSNGEKEKETEKDRPFAGDVLTVHQKQYYDSTANMPNDYDSPNPVSFVTVRPKVRLLFALSGPADWTALAEPLLRDALAKWGVGGKTSSGYGRLVPPEDLRPGELWPAARLTFNRNNGTLTATGPIVRGNPRLAYASNDHVNVLLASLPRNLQEKVRRNEYVLAQVRVDDQKILSIAPRTP